MFLIYKVEAKYNDLLIKSDGVEVCDIVVVTILANHP